MLTKLVYLYYRWFGYPDTPPRWLFSSEPKPKKRIYSDGYHWPRYYDMAWRYWAGNDIEIMAEKYNVTRTRVRSCLWKYLREQNRVSK